MDALRTTISSSYYSLQSSSQEEPGRNTLSIGHMTGANGSTHSITELAPSPTNGKPGTAASTAAASVGSTVRHSIRASDPSFTNGKPGTAASAVAVSVINQGGSAPSTPANPVVTVEKNFTQVDKAQSNKTQRQSWYEWLTKFKFPCITNFAFPKLSIFSSGPQIDKLKKNLDEAIWLLSTAITDVNITNTGLHPTFKNHAMAVLAAATALEKALGSLTQRNLQLSDKIENARNQVTRTLKRLSDEAAKQQLELSSVNSSAETVPEGPRTIESHINDFLTNLRALHHVRIPGKFYPQAREYLTKYSFSAEAQASVEAAALQEDQQAEVAKDAKIEINEKVKMDDAFKDWDYGGEKSEGAQ